MEMKSVQNYIADYTGLEFHFQPWITANKLPLFLSANFSYYNAETDFGTLLTIESKSEMSFSKISNASAQLRKYCEIKTSFIFILSKPSSYLTKRLIDQKIAFVVPGRQIYAPFLGAIYSQKTRESYTHKPSLSKTVSSELTPSSLLVYLFLLQSGFNHKQTEIISHLGISRMTLYRAYKELISEEMIVLNENSGEMSLPQDWKVNFKLNSRKFKNPIRKRVYVEGAILERFASKLFFKTSESALADKTDLAETTNASLAIAMKDWKKMESEFTPVPYLENSSIIVEIWSMPVPNKNGSVLPLALYITMKNNTDERVKMGLEQMLVEELKNYD